MSRSDICGVRFIVVLFISIINNCSGSSRPYFFVLWRKGNPALNRCQARPSKYISVICCVLHFTDCIAIHCHGWDPKRPRETEKRSCRFGWRWLYSNLQRVPTPTDKFVLESKPAPATRETWYAAININHVISTVLRGPCHVLYVRMPSKRHWYIIY